MNHYYGRRRKWFLIIPLLAVAAAFLMGVTVMLLWNAVLIPVIGVHTITFWQALGLLVLTRILFGSFFKGGGRHRGGPFMGKEKWANMSDEEKLKFRDQWKHRCGGGYATQPTETKEQQTE